MGIETVQTKIGGHEYKLQTFGARQGMTVAMTLIRFLGPTMAEALGGNSQVRKAAKAVQAGLGGADLVDGAGVFAVNQVDVASAAEEADLAFGDMLVRGIQTFSTTATDADFQVLIQAFVGKCKLVQPLITKAGNESTDIQLTLETFDRHFAGRYRDLMMWLVWCIKENFADFFGGLGNASQGEPQTPKV